jgi:WNK lysine deficient protein kinase
MKSEMSSQVNDERLNMNSNPEGVVEMSENHRYIRFHDIIRITFNGLLTSYKAFDTTDGVEIGWHKILIPADISEIEKQKFDDFMQHLSQLGSSKDYFVENLSYWFSPVKTIDTSENAVDTEEKHCYLNIITTNYETIREFIGKVKTLRWKIVKKWCRQLLKALAKLRNDDDSSNGSTYPPIVHHYLSLSHIYIDGGLGTIAVGDIWLSYRSGSFDLANSLHENVSSTYNDSNGDIYAFGLCVLEMVSKENSRRKSAHQQLAPQFSTEYITSVLPRINDQAREFIELCLLPSESRPSVDVLQRHPFLLSDPTIDDEEVKLGKGV